MTIHSSVHIGWNDEYVYIYLTLGDVVAVQGDEDMDLFNQLEAAMEEEHPQEIEPVKTGNE